MLGPAQARATVDKSKVFRASISVEFDNGRRVHAEVVVRLKDQGIKGQNAKDQNTKDQGDEPYELLLLAGRFRWSDLSRRKGRP